MHVAPGIDLHAHTTASDGSLTPTQLVRAAAQIGLSALAVTDHDTIGGLAEAQREARIQKIRLVPGVELSVEDEGGRFHLLGYLFDPENAALRETLVRIRANRVARNAQMGQKMVELGLPVTMADVEAEAGEGDVIARPHFAQALLKKGIVHSVKEAFDRFLATGKPLYLPKQVLTPHDAIALLQSAGGLAVMAHPGLVPLSREALAARIVSLTQEDKLDGIEAYYSQHTPAQTKDFLALAHEYNLIVTGGSDFHGLPKPDVPLGIVYQSQPASPSLLGAMEARLAAR